MPGAPAQHHSVECFPAEGHVKSLIFDSAKDRMGILLCGLNFRGKKDSSLLRKAVHLACNDGN